MRTTQEADKEEVEDIQCWLFKNKVITSKVCYRHLKGLLLNENAITI